MSLQEYEASVNPARRKGFQPGLSLLVGALQSIYQGGKLKPACWLLAQHRRRKIFISGGGANFGETCQRHVRRVPTARYGKGVRDMLPLKMLNFRCVFLQSGGI